MNVPGRSLPATLVLLAAPLAAQEKGTEEGDEGSGSSIGDLFEKVKDIVDVLPAQGRLVSRNDRRTLLAVGQPVAVLGTCQGARLGVSLTNGRIEGLVEKKKEPKDE